MNFYGHTKTGG